MFYLKIVGEFYISITYYMQSDQYFIIWNHGFKYLHQIMSIIRDHPSIEITRIFKRTVNLNHFIKHIYKLDKSSYQHIEAKSRYLQSMKPEIFIVFVTDIDTLYKTKPNSKHRYSYHETFLKWHIRLLFNPRTQDTNVDITRDLIDNASVQKHWPSTITHDHIIHSSDIEEETQLVIDYFNLNKHWFNLFGNKYSNHKKTIKDVNVDELVVNTTYEDYMNVKSTPHYKYLLGGYRTEYDKYIIDHLGTVITCDNLSGAYDKLIKNFEYGKLIEGQPSYIVCQHNEKLNKYVVLDGVHRLAVLVRNGAPSVKVFVVE